MCLHDIDYFNKNYDFFVELGAFPIAISAQLQEATDRIVRAHRIKFPFIADHSRTAGAKFQLVYDMTKQEKKKLKDLGFNLDPLFGMEDISLYLPATYVVDQNGVIVYAFLDEDVTNRPNLEEMAYYIRKAKKDRKKLQAKLEQEKTPIKNLLLTLQPRLGHKGRVKRSSSKSSLASSTSNSSLQSSQAGDTSKDRDSLLFCIGQEVFFEGFQMFLEKSVCVENLLFFLEASDYMVKFHSLTEEEQKSEALRIADTFLTVGGDLEVNVDEITREKILIKCKEGLVRDNLFSPAALEIYQLLESDSLRKWRRTQEFHKIWEANGCPEAVSPIPDFAR